MEHAGRGRFSLPPGVAGVYTALPFFFATFARLSPWPERGPRAVERRHFMRLYPKVIPTIAREVVQTLMQDGDIEVETLRIADAEMDMAAIMKEYLAAEEIGRA